MANITLHDKDVTELLEHGFPPEWHHFIRMCVNMHLSNGTNDHRTS
jgi:hypothetical protein